MEQALELESEPEPKSLKGSVNQPSMPEIESKHRHPTPHRTASASDWSEEESQQQQPHYSETIKSCFPLARLGW